MTSLLKVVIRSLTPNIQMVQTDQSVETHDPSSILGAAPGVAPSALNVPESIPIMPSINRPTFYSLNFAWPLFQVAPNSTITFFSEVWSLKVPCLSPHGSSFCVSRVYCVTMHVATLVQNKKDLLLSHILYSDIYTHSVLFRKYCIPSHCSVFSIPASAPFTCQV